MTQRPGREPAERAGQPRDRTHAGGGLTRAWAAPMRAVTRIWTAPGQPVDGPVDAAGRSPIVDCALYVDGRRQPGRQEYGEALRQARERPNAFVWLGLHEPGQAEMAGIAEAYGLHELAVEDAVKAAQRPKLEHFADTVRFLVLRTARYVEHAELTESSEVVETGQVLMFVGPEFIITVRHGDACNLSPVRADLESKHDLLRQGPWAVAYAVTDRVVDLYLDVADGVQEDLDEVEEGVFSSSPAGHGSTTAASIQRIYQLKRELVEFRRAVSPLQRPLTVLGSETSDEIPPGIRHYFRDVLDHLTRVVEQVNADDDLLNSILQARLAQISVDQNNDMRKIAAWAAIAAVQTAIAGVYGMNFRVMPELEWEYGYPAVLVLMLSLAAGLYRFFRRAGWL